MKFKMPSKFATGLSRRAMQKKITTVWEKAFPYLTAVLLLFALVRLGIIGFHALYRSDLSEEELKSRTVIEEKKNQFKQEQFDAILRDIQQRAERSTLRTRTVEDIFYQSSIERKKEQKR